MKNNKPVDINLSHSKLCSLMSDAVAWAEMRLGWKPCWSISNVPWHNFWCFVGMLLPLRQFCGMLSSPYLNLRLQRKRCRRWPGDGAVGQRRPYYAGFLGANQWRRTNKLTCLVETCSSAKPRKGGRFFTFVCMLYIDARMWLYVLLPLGVLCLPRSIFETWLLLIWLHWVLIVFACGLWMTSCFLRDVLLHKDVLNDPLFSAECWKDPPSEFSSDSLITIVCVLYFVPVNLLKNCCCLGSVCVCLPYPISSRDYTAGRV